MASEYNFSGLVAKVKTAHLTLDKDCPPITACLPVGGRSAYGQPTADAADRLHQFEVVCRVAISLAGIGYHSGNLVKRAGGLKGLGIEEFGLTHHEVKYCLGRAHNFLSEARERERARNKEHHKQKPPGMELLVKLFALAIMAVALAACEHHDTPPPGFGIQCDNKGHYRAVYIETQTEVFTFAKLKSRQQAIDRAWSQFQYENEQRAGNWGECPEDK